MGGHKLQSKTHGREYGVSEEVLCEESRKPGFNVPTSWYDQRTIHTGSNGNSLKKPKTKIVGCVNERKVTTMNV